MLLRALVTNVLGQQNHSYKNCECTGLYIAVEVFATNNIAYCADFACFYK